MKTYSFSGPSGTGKSSFALEFAHQNNIEAIIDDGLLIINGEIKAGTSAKFEKSSIKAVKRAIFQDADHVQEVKEAIEAFQPGHLMIIGTSDKMTKLIAKRLGFEKIDEFHHIENYRSRHQMKMAQFIRRTEGKHIMPIPVVQVQQNFFKRLIMKGYEIFTSKREKIGETTIVQPDFHQDLDVFHKKDFIQCISKSCNSSKIVKSIEKIDFTLYPLPITTVTFQYDLDETNEMVHKLEQLQRTINGNFDEQFKIEFFEVNLKIKSIRKMLEKESKQN